MRAKPEPSATASMTIAFTATTFVLVDTPAAAAADTKGKKKGAAKAPPKK